MLPKYQGLTSTIAANYLQKSGLNILPEKLPPSPLLIFLRQFKNPLVYILIFAFLLTLFIGHFSDALIIFVAVFINTILGFIQENKASRALYALKKMVAFTAQVLRDDKLIKIDASQIVPGDIVVLSAGSKIPADGILLEAKDVFVNEAMLTGESLAVSKSAKGEVFMGTVMVAGRGVMQVVATGKNTQIGKIAQEVQIENEETVFKKQLEKFSRQIVILVIFLTIFVFVTGLLLQKELLEIFTTSVALAVSGVPEGLLIGLTVILAIGMQKILKNNGLVRNLAAAEILGGITTVCTDKTGTLTEGKMKVVDIKGDVQKASFQAIVANDLDDPIVIAAYEWAAANLKNPKELIKDYERLDYLPFSSSARFSGSLHIWNSQKNLMCVNGAPDFILEWCNLPAKKKKEIKNQIQEATRSGKRVMGMARKFVPSGKEKISANDVRKNLTWVGFLVFSDPVRPGVASLITTLGQAGIRTIVITGDFSETAKFVMQEAGISVTDGEILTGEELKKLSLDELCKKVSSTKLFARTTPEQKLKIVTALKRNGEVVAMLGDGVNDAPALSTSDIGVVVGDASDVSRETADLVLLDSNFKTLVAAIHEGRGIFENIRKVILYLMCDAFGEIVLVVATLLVNLPLPITAVQILWINIVSDGFPHLALTIDPKRTGIMHERPRDPKESLVNGWMKGLIATISFTSGILGFVVFFTLLVSGYSLEFARSVTFLIMAVNSLLYVFSVKTLYQAFSFAEFFKNRWLLVAVVGGFALQIIPFLTSTTRSFFGVTALPISYWLLAIMIAFVMFAIIEVSKLFLRHRGGDDRWQQNPQQV